jgi:hypothetical protein
MKKTQIIAISLLLLILFATISVKSISVTPAEISISMESENFISGNTTKKIIVTNDNNFTFNVTWYKEHPNPTSTMRPNKTRITNLSWIDAEPKWLNIPAKSTGDFYIHLNIPEAEENYNQNWETWITFKGGKQVTSGGTFNFEYAIRVYIDTPVVLPAETDDEISIPLLEITILAIIIILLIGFVVIVKKKKT